MSLAGLAVVLVIEDRLEQGARLLGAARAAGYPGPDPDDQAMLKRLERAHFDAARARVGESAWIRLTQLGGELSFEQAIAFALAETDRPDHAAMAAAETVAGSSSSDR